MKYKINFSEEDYIRYNVFASKHLRLGRRSRNITRFSIPFFALCILLIFIVSGKDSDLIMIEAAFLAVLSVVWIALTPKMVDSSIRRNIKKAKKDGKIPTFSEAEIEFRDDDIVEKTQRSVSQVKYEDVEKVYFTKNYIYIFVGVVQAIVIPRSCLGGDWEKVKQFLTEKKLTVYNEEKNSKESKSRFFRP